MDQNNLDNDIEFLDILSIIGFVIGLKNYSESLTQRDKQDLVYDLNQKTDILLKDIHEHLRQQDEKIDKILNKLNYKDNENIGY